ncbi:MAG: PASTA domain-containing protein [Actinomycetota bacterium]|nr:PASTA domain-containing protein [Actinomycetota bacterium]
MAYTVDEVSNLLDIPRPTLYRYLREYSIPHVRRSGKISIPEESFDRIREARELHREGLGTESVRVRLCRGKDLDAEELVERLAQLCRKLEHSWGDTEVVDRPLSVQALQDIQKSHNVLISAVFELNEKVESLLDARDQFRGEVLSGPSAEEKNKHRTFLGRPEARSIAEGERVAGGLSTKDLRKSAESLAVPVRRGSFGTLSRQRRLGILAFLLLLVVVPVLMWAVPNRVGGEMDGQIISSEQNTENNSQSVPSEGEGQGAVEVPDLTGAASSSEAREELARAGLGFVVQDIVPNDVIPAGRVVAQDPAAGAETYPNSAVNVVISSGPSEFQNVDVDEGSGAIYGNEEALSGPPR